MEKVYKAHERRDVFPLEFRRRFGAFDLQEGCYYECPPEWTVYNLRYSYHRMYYIVDGESWYQDDERRVPLKKNHLYIFPSQFRRYSVNHNPRMPLKVLWCHFELYPDIVNELIEYDVCRDANMQSMIHAWRICRSPATSCPASPCSYSTFWSAGWSLHMPTSILRT